MPEDPAVYIPHPCIPSVRLSLESETDEYTDSESESDEEEYDSFSDPLERFILKHLDTDSSCSTYASFFSYNPADRSYGQGLALLYSSYQYDSHDLDSFDEGSPVGMLAQAIRTAVGKDDQTAVIIDYGWLSNFHHYPEGMTLVSDRLAFAITDTLRLQRAKSPEEVDSVLKQAIPGGAEKVMETLVRHTRVRWQLFDLAVGFQE
ncbi:hypothetical protein [Spongorhabdus nitratireducens]